MENESNNERVVSSQGMEVTKDAVEFVNAQVLQTKVTNSGFSAHPLVDQATAMMVQDVRTFLQGSEQMTMAALGKAMGMAVSSDPTEQAAGLAAIATIGNLMKNLSTAAAEIGSTASSIKKGFND
ncbi:MAG: hypothetical protein AB8E82_04025 [Aureispira sp.]